MNLYQCKKCGSLLELIESNENLVCCEELVSKINIMESDGALEKHKPVVDVVDDKIEVSIGSVAHPMEEEHYISYVFLKTKNKVERIKLNINDEPKVVFNYQNDAIVYALCNKHGLWETKVD